MENNYDAAIKESQYDGRFRLDGTNSGKEHNFSKVNDMTIIVKVGSRCKYIAARRHNLV